MNVAWYALQIGAYDDSSVFLLNPVVLDQDGEWEVWHFDPKYPGATRWRSFAALPAATLLELVDGNPTDVTVTAAHALVSIRGREAATALTRLLSAEDAQLQRLAASWRPGWRRVVRGGTRGCCRPTAVSTPA
jgi:hypothetical protein